MADTIPTTSGTSDVAAQLREMLATIRILPRRMLLDTPGVAATIPMLRGVWGAALHDLDGEVYRRVFGPNEESMPPRGARSRGLHEAVKWAAQREQRTRERATLPRGQNTLVPSYVLRPAPPDPIFAPACDWILFGPAVADDDVLRRAWDVASGMGLGPERRRFHVRRTTVVQPDATLDDAGNPWTLDAARPLLVDPVNPARILGIADEQLAAITPCRLLFPAPLRIMFHGKLVQRPTLTDLVVAACRRIESFLPAEQAAEWSALKREAIELSRQVAATPWQGARLDLHRYSARQQTEIDLRGVTGSLDLPVGPGPLWPLLAAAQWLHLGKGTVMGLGQLWIASLHQAS